MKIAVVHPRDTVAEHHLFRDALPPRSLGGYGFASEFLTFEPELLALASELSRRGVNARYHDENLAGPFVPSKEDLVVAGGVACQAEGLYALADLCAARGIRCVLAGLHASLVPREALRHAPAVLAGNPAQGADALLEDARLRDGVTDAPADAAFLTDYALLAGREPDVYPVVASRGCGNGCLFCCAGTARPHVRRAPRDVAREFAAIRARRPDAAIVLVDDNLFGDPDWLLALAAALSPLRTRFAAHGDVGGAASEEAVEALAAAGLMRLFVGLESLSAEALERVAPAKALLLPHYATFVERFQSAGIGALASFVVGFDGEGDAPARIREFVATVAPLGLTVSLLTPMPGTPLHAEYERAGRIVERRLSRYTQFHPVIDFGDRLAPLVEGVRALMRDFHAPAAVGARVRRLARLAAGRVPGAWRRGARNEEGKDEMKTEETKFRIERDTMGEVRVPAEALWGAGTQRALENFRVSPLRMPSPFLRALGLIKRAAAEANAELGLLERDLAAAIVDAATEVAANAHDRSFPLDVFQTGSGTSTHMNANEVIARRARQLLEAAGEPRAVHPNDHVNRGQSSNDVVPSAIHVACVERIERGVLPALSALAESLGRLAARHAGTLKIGRTHLNDATPMTLGQEFSAYAAQAERAADRFRAALPRLLELPLGGTAVGNGINTHPGFASRAIGRLAMATGHPFRAAENRFEAQGAKDACVELSGAMRAAAVSLSKIANDLRWLASGPRCGLGEIRLPELQPGSSIMPGKVNPVMPEMLLQACAHVIGGDATVTLCGLGGNFELNTMMPLLAHTLLSSLDLLERSVRVFTERCVDGIEADAERCAELVERSLALATPLALHVGYDGAARIAKAAAASGRTVREVAREAKILPEEELARVLDPRRLALPEEEREEPSSPPGNA